MNVNLPFPPKTVEAIAAWLEQLYRRVNPECSTSGDADAVIPSASTYHGITALTNARALTLPSTRSLRDGDQVIIQDESNAAGSNTVTLSAASGDAAVGSTTITTNRGRRTCVKRGTTWFCA